MIANGDFLPDSQGFPQLVTGVRELTQQALILLTVQRGSFALQPELGGNLSQLSKAPSDQVEAMADCLVRQALAPLPQLSVEEVRCRREEGRVSLSIRLMAGEESLALEVETT